MWEELPGCQALTARFTRFAVRFLREGMKRACRLQESLLVARPHPPMEPARLARNIHPVRRQSGRSSGVEHNLAKVGVEGSNPFARSSFSKTFVV